MITREEANLRSKEITQMLNERVDRANQDPRLMLGRKEGDWYLPIKRNAQGRKFPWTIPECRDWNCHLDPEEHSYEWAGGFEFGNSESSAGFYIYYYPNPEKYGKKNMMMQEEWLKINPEADLSRTLYAMMFSEVKVVSNNFDDVLAGLDSLIEKIAQSRK